MIGEVFPLNIRGLGNSFSSVINWAANALVSLTFPYLLNLFGTRQSVHRIWRAVLPVHLVRALLCVRDPRPFP